MHLGSRIGGRFLLEDVAGRGASGVVFRARDEETGHLAAVKVLTFGNDDRFAREIALLSKLRHPAIVAYLAHGTLADGDAWLAMEWIDGETLRARLARCGVTGPEAIALVRRVAEAVAVVHRGGAVHRDLKPENLMVPGGDLARVKLLDFGIARQLVGEASVTMTGGALGTPAYMAPEQARGERVDARADVYALGAILYECVTGQTPFVADSAHAMLLKIVLEAPAPLRELREGAPEELEAFVSRLLAKDPAARPATAEEVARGLEAFDLAGLTGAASEPAARSLRTTQITGLERHVQAIVLARPQGHVDAVTDRGTVVIPAVDASIGADVARHRGVLHVLADGGVLVTLGGATASDLAVAAARCAASLRARWPEASMVLAFAQAEAAQPLMSGAIDAAVALLDADRDGRVRLTPEMASALEHRFEITVDRASAYLDRERRDERAGRTLLGKPTPCVGRDPELALLAATLAQCFDDGAARAVLVTGPAGLGKSRLRSEFLRRVADVHGDDVAVWVAQGDPMSAGSPLGMIGRMLRHEAGLRDDEPAAAREAKFRARFSRHLPASSAPRAIDFLAHLAAVPLASAPGVEITSARQNPVLMADQLRAAWSELVRAEAAARPLLLVFEDLHAGDAGTVRFVDAALRELEAAPFFVLALARPEVLELFPKLWASRNLQTIVLRELGAKPAERLVRHALGAGVAPGAVARIVERAAGNPFFLEELVRAEAAGARGALPDTVLATLDARLAQLDPEARRVLRAGSVFGRVFWRDGAVALLGGSGGAPRIDDWLAVLEDAEVIVRRGVDRFADHVAFGFRHALVCDAAYATLTVADRATGHRLAAAWLERAGEADPSALASHHVRAGEAEKAVSCYRLAADAALDANDLEGAITFAARAVESGAAGQELGLVKLVEAEASRWLNRTAAALAATAEATAHLPARTRAWYRATGQRALLLRGSSDTRDLVALSSTLDAPILAGDTFTAHAEAVVHTVMMLALRGVASEARPLVARLDALDPQAAGASVRAYLLRCRRVLAPLQGDIAGGLTFAEAARDAFTATDDGRNACFEELYVATHLLRFGCWADAVASCERAAVLAERLNLPRLLASAHLNQGYALAHLGRTDEGLRWLERASAAFSVDDQRMGGGVLAYIADVHRMGGDLDAAARVVADAIARLEGDPVLALALAVATAVHLERGDFAAALVTSARGAALLAELGTVEEGEIRLRLGRALALHAANAANAGGWRAALAEAEAALLAQASHLDGHPELRRSFLEDIPEHARLLAWAAAIKS